MDFHPVADIFPLMGEVEFGELAEDIRENGLLEPIWVYCSGDSEERIIDGRNRYLACERVGVVPAFRRYSGVDSGLVAFVLSLNLRRRHLSESQRAMVAARVSNLSDGQRKAGSPIGEATTQGVVVSRSRVDCLSRGWRPQGFPRCSRRESALHDGEYCCSG